MAITSVEEYLETQPEDVAELISYLHQELLSFPLTPKIRYGIPFYYAKSWVCYLNPLKTGGVELVFLRANELSGWEQELDSKGRKQVGGMDFRTIKDISESSWPSILQEALILDDQVPYASKRTKK